MIFKWTRLLVLLLVSGIIYYSFQVGIPFLESPLPAFGKLINPYTGFLKNNRTLTNHPSIIESDLIKDDVTIKWDERGVPHIFAKNNYDLYFVQGYITAKDRLWQMDFVSRASSGRLAEVVGAKATNYDQFHRRIGLSSSAKMVIDTIKTYVEEYEALQAYSDGVNAYIDQLKPAQRPIEFKLMNYKPEKWSPYKSALILKYMAWDLDGSPSDKYITMAKNVLPNEVFEQAFPLYRPNSETIIPTSEKIQSLGAKKELNNQITSSLPLNPQFKEDQYRKGSNNWVVNGSKTRSGLPILANDPHLGLSLPALWYENQLQSNDVNVYGVSLPGIPMTVIGFNENIAWGLTYTTSDCIDFVNIELNEEGNQYQLDGLWESLQIIVDTILVKGSQKRINQTLITEFGPIIYTDSIPNEGYNHMIPATNYAMNWTAHGPTLEFLTFYRLNRANNLEDFQAALPYFSAPGQNFVFASNENDIAIWHNGKFPIREAEYARFIQDTATSNLKWENFIPFNQLPHSINPLQGYLMSANQQPISQDYPYYLGSDDYADFERANRIKEVLSSLESIVPEDFKKLQADKKSMMAEYILPNLLESLPQRTLTVPEKDVFLELQNWDYEYSHKSKAPGFFHAWMRELRIQIWKDEAIDTFQNQAWWMPFTDVTNNLILNQKNSKLFDNKTTDNVETREDIILSSYQSALTSFTEEFGSLNEDWEWGKINPTKINSMADIDGFGLGRVLNTGGAGESVNAINGDYGPSWRMIVALGEEKPTAYGVYPGGQTGNPGSSTYDEFVDTWAKSGYFELHLFDDENSTGDLSVTTTKITKKQ